MYNTGKVGRISLEYEELKQFVFNYIMKGSTSFQLANFYPSFANYLMQHEIIKDPHPSNYLGGTIELDNSDKLRIREIIWDYVIERILTIGDYYNNDPSYFSLTEYGEKLKLEYEKDLSTVIPNDPTGYISRLKSNIPNIDPVIEVYLFESIRTYNINQLLSSTITLGCASEKALLLLIESYISSFKEDSKSVAFSKKVSNKFIKSQYEEFRKAYDALPKEQKLGDDFPLNGVFEMIRKSRNDAGHPTGAFIDKSALYAHLQVFIGYCKYIYDLMDFFTKNKHN